MAKTLIGYVGNKIAGKVELDTDVLAGEYLASGIEESRAGWPLDRKVLMFLAITDHTDDDGAVMTGKNISWDRDEGDNAEAYEALIDKIIERRR